MSKQTGLIVLLTSVAAFSLGAASPQTADAERLTALRERQIELLAYVAKLSRQQFNAGDGSFWEMNAAEMAYTDARVSAASNQQEKLAFLEERIEGLKQTQKRVDLLTKEGVSSPSTVVKVELAIIDAEIDYLTMKIK